MMGFFYQ